jgi:exodeoxyribonuclease-1
MNICIWDLESLGSDTGHSSICEFAAILLSDDFKELDRVDIRCRIPEGEIPQCGALLTNKLSIKMLTTANLSHYQLIDQIEKTFSKWSPCIFIAYSGINFDEEMIRKEFFKGVRDPYLTTKNQNKRHDALNIVRAAYALNPKIFKTELNEKGNVLMKLESLARLNGLDTTNSHRAINDVEHAKFFLEKVYKDQPNTWNSCLMTSSKEKTENLIKDEKMFTLVDYYYGKSKFHLCSPLHKEFLHHPVYRGWLQAVDLRADIENLTKLSVSDLKIEMKKSPKFIRQVRSNKAVVIIHSDFGIGKEPYNVMKPDLLKKRAELAKDKNFAQKVSTILRENAQEKQETADQSDIEAVDSIYKKFTDGKDTALFPKWHQSSWEDKLRMLDSFEDKRLVEFGKNLIYQEAPEILPDSIKKEVMRNIARKILSDKKEKWWTVKEFYNECDNYRQEYTEKKDDEKIKFLNEINDYVEGVEKKYQNV